MTHFKHYTIGLISLTFFYFSLTTGGLVLVDPLQIFHKPWVRDSYYINELRFQAAGIINNTEFDSMVLGTSFAANFSAEEASAIWGDNFVNISPSGSWLSERSVILNYALKKKKLKNVIMSLDGADIMENQKLSFPTSNYDYLYNDNRIDDLKLYSNTKYLSYLFCNNLLFDFEEYCTTTKDLEHVAEWASDREENRRFGGIENWFKAIDNGQVKQGLLSIAKTTREIRNGNIKNLDEQTVQKRIKLQNRSFDRYLLHYIHNNPDTQFYLFFPPVSRMLQGLQVQSKPDDYKIYLEYIRYVVNITAKYTNVKVYGFDHLEFTNDIANYKDSVHFSKEINSAMLMWMKYDNYLLTPANVENYILNTSDIAANYDVFPLANQIINFLEQNNIR